MNKSILAEFHCHSNYSFDSLVSLEDIISTCRARGIAKIAITDHGCMEGAYKAHQMAPDLVIVSEEIQTSEGEILGYFMTEEIPDGLVVARGDGCGAEDRALVGVVAARGGGVEHERVVRDLVRPAHDAHAAVDAQVAEEPEFLRHRVRLPDLAPSARWTSTFWKT